MSTRDYTLITGGAGFIGSNLAHTLLSDGKPVVIVDTLARAGVENNLKWLKREHGELVRLERADVSDVERITPLVRGAVEVYHLAAQVAVTTSLDDPRADLQSNLIGTFNILEAARGMDRPPPILFTSTNKVYGGLQNVSVEKQGIRYGYADGRDGICEATPIDFHSPYGCSKGAADQYVRDYARVYGLPTVVFRMSCIYGTRQFGTEDQGWVAHFARSLLAGEPITVYGDGCQVRDILWVDDLIAAMRRATGRISRTAGEVFNMGGGPENAVSVRTVIDELMEITGRKVPVMMDDWRPGDQRVFISDTSKAARMLGWEPRTDWRDGLHRLVDWLEDADLSTPVLPLRKKRQAAVASAGL